MAKIYLKSASDYSTNDAFHFGNLGYSPADFMEEIFNDEDEEVNWRGDIW